VFSRTLLDAVEAALPPFGRGQAPQDIARRVDGYALVTVRHALRDLVNSSRAVFTGPDSQRRYSLPASA
jgi:hypothetical protein